MAKASLIHSFQTPAAPPELRNASYQTQLAKIKLLQTAVDQAKENERITESKYQNNLVTTTDRIDAQSQLYQARIQLQLAQSDASIAYYNVLRSTGKIHL